MTELGLGPGSLGPEVGAPSTQKLPSFVAQENKTICSWKKELYGVMEMFYDWTGVMVA